MREYFDEDGEMICPVMCDRCTCIVPLDSCGGPNMWCRNCRQNEAEEDNEEFDE